MLAASFGAPDQPGFPGQVDYQSLYEIMVELCPESSEPAQTMSEEIEGSKEQELLVEHTRLFLGPFGVPVPPYGSIYLEDGGRLMGESTLAVQSLYRDAGLRIDDGFRDASDHISAELEFVHYLAYEEFEARSVEDVEKARDYLEKQTHFIESYLATWSTVFANRIVENSKRGFYRAFGECLGHFIPEDLENLKSRLRSSL